MIIFKVLFWVTFISSVCILNDWEPCCGGVIMCDAYELFVKYTKRFLLLVHRAFVGDCFMCNECPGRYGCDAFGTLREGPLSVVCETQ